MKRTLLSILTGLKPELFFAAFVVIAPVFTGCEPEETRPGAQVTDTIHPVIHLLGKGEDTTYLQVSSTTLIANGTSSYTWLPGSYTNYADPGTRVFEATGVLRNSSGLPVEVTGTVNNKFPGTYYLHYNTVDEAGNKAATVTRTVHVVENSAAPLNGSYAVACSCTAVVAGSPEPTVTTNSYTASVIASGVDNNNFQLSTLRIGPEYVMAVVSLCDTAMGISYTSFSSFIADGKARISKDILSSAQKTFTVETTLLPFHPAVTYHCNNVYTKQPDLR